MSWALRKVSVRTTASAIPTFPGKLSLAASFQAANLLPPQSQTECSGSGPEASRGMSDFLELYKPRGHVSSEQLAVLQLDQIVLFCGKMVQYN